MRSLKAVNTVVRKVDPARPAKEAIASGAMIIRKGGLVAFPTETVYGLAANLSDRKAIASLYRVKDRPKTKPFTVHIADTKIIRKMGCRITRPAQALMKKFWPGPLTIILAAKNGSKVGFRMPDNKVALELIKASRVPVVAPSANASGKNPPKCAKDVLRDLCGRIELVLDAGPARVGIESTVVDMTVKPFKVLRKGAISEGAISRAIGHGKN